VLWPVNGSPSPSENEPRCPSACGITRMSENRIGIKSEAADRLQRDFGRLQPPADLVESRFGAGFVEFAARRAADADRGDRLVTDLDPDRAWQQKDVRQLRQPAGGRRVSDPLHDG